MLRVLPLPMRRGTLFDILKTRVSGRKTAGLGGPATPVLCSETAEQRTGIAVPGAPVQRLPPSPRSTVVPRGFNPLTVQLPQNCTLSAPFLHRFHFNSPASLSRSRLAPCKTIFQTKWDKNQKLRRSHRCQPTTSACNLGTTVPKRP